MTCVGRGGAAVRTPDRSFESSAVGVFDQTTPLYIQEMYKAALVAFAYGTIHDVHMIYHVALGVVVHTKT